VDDETGEQHGNLVAFIMGKSSDRGHVTISGSYLDRGGLQIGDRYDDFGQSGLSSFGQPGGYVALGAVTATPNFFDPVGPMGVPGLVGSSCIYDFSSFFNLVMETTEAKIHVARCFMHFDRPSSPDTAGQE
jgi:hypothetical protein